MVEEKAVQPFVFQKILVLEIFHQPAIIVSFVYFVPLCFSQQQWSGFMPFPIFLPHSRNDLFLLNFILLQNSFRILLWIPQYGTKCRPQSCSKAVSEHKAAPIFQNSHTVLPACNKGTRLCHPYSFRSCTLIPQIWL